MSKESKKEETVREIISVKNLYKLYRVGDSVVRALDGVSFSVYEGEFCAIVGTSGSGKSTLLNIIGGIDGADEGSITIDGEQLEDMTEKKLSLYRRKHLGYIFQMYNLIPNLTLRENIEIGAYLSNGAGSLCVHFITPVLAIIDFIFFSEKYLPEKRHVFYSVIPPLVYVGYVILLGQVFGVRWYGDMLAPYNFLNYGASTGWFGFDLSLLGSKTLGIGTFYICLLYTSPSPRDCS